MTAPGMKLWIGARPAATAGAATAGAGAAGAGAGAATGGAGEYTEPANGLGMTLGRAGALNVGAGCPASAGVGRSIA